MTRFRYPVAVAALVALTVLFVTNRRYVYSEALGALPDLTAAHIVDPRFAGTTVQIEGRVTSVRTTRQGIVIIEMHEPTEDLFVDVPVFPTLGCLPVKPVRGETVRIAGNLGMYSGQPQVRPLSSAHVVLTPPTDAVSAAAAATQVGATLLVGPLIALDAEFFESRAGREHLRLTLADAGRPAGAATARVQGIMFEGDQTDCEVDLLLSDEPFLATAEVEMFQGAPSLNVQRVFPVDTW